MKFAKGGHAWLLRGACMVAPGGHAWLHLGGHALMLPGVCMVAPGGMHGCSWGGVCGCSGGACMVALGGHAWLLRGMHGCSGRGVHGCSGEGCAWLLLGGMRGCSGGGVRGFFGEIRSMSGRYASYWNAFLLQMPSLVEFFAVNTKLPINSNIGIKGFYRSKKKLSPVGFDLMITGSRDYYWFDCLMFNQLR